jgi:CTD kinase subunit beta
MIKLAWRLAVDAQRTLAPLVYPPHEIALASLYVAAFLAPLQGIMADRKAVPPGDSQTAAEATARSPQEIATLLSTSGYWEQQYHAYAEDIDG